MGRGVRRDERAVLEALAAQTGAVTLSAEGSGALFAVGSVADPAVSLPVAAAGGAWRLEVPEAGEACARVAVVALERLAAARDAMDDYALATRRLWSEQNVLFTAGEVLREGLGEAGIASWLAGRLEVVPSEAVTVLGWDGAVVRHAAGAPAKELPEGELARVLGAGEPVALTAPAGPEAGEGAGRAPVLLAPLRHAGRVLGAAVLRRAPGEAAFSSEEVKLAQLLADLASVALANRLLVGEAGRNARFQRDLELAAEIQQRLLPPRRARYGALDVAALCEPVAWVGGDGYLHRSRPGAPVALAVIDVAGHGVAASLALAALTARLETLVDVVTSPGGLLSVLNRGILLHEPDATRPVTAAVVFVHPEHATLQFASAGHPPGLVFRRGGAVDNLGLGGLPLGVAWDATYDVREASLGPGDTLVLYSDGVSEALGAGDSLAGVEVLAGLPLAEASGVDGVVDRLMEAVGGRRTGGAEDDTTVLAVRRLEATDG